MEKGDFLDLGLEQICGLTFGLDRGPSPSDNVPSRIPLYLEDTTLREVSIAQNVLVSLQAPTHLPMECRVPSIAEE